MADLAKSIEGVQPGPNTAQFRRIVTGHDENGKAVFVEDQICPNRFAIGGVSEFITNEIWRVNENPADIAGEYVDTTAVPFNIRPERTGNVFRIMEFPPDGMLGMQDDGVTPEPPMKHRTASLDYAMVLKGEIYAVLDDDELLMKEGDILIQRGTIHAWSNRSNEGCVILFVLCGSDPTPGLEYK